MCHMNRSRLAVLVLILGGLFAAAPALAVKYIRSVVTSTWLVPPESCPPEPDASGKCTREFVRAPGQEFHEFDVTVTCRKLTPARQYHVLWGRDWGVAGSYPVTADGKGKLSVQFTVMSDRLPWVVVTDDEGCVVLQEEY